MKHETHELKDLKYVIGYPDNFSEEKEYPVILCLHGSGGRGNDVSKLLANPFFEETAKFKDFPFVLIAPLCSENTWFDLWEVLKALVHKVAFMPFVDKKRIYMMGASMGGYATWQLAMSMPEYFAAIAPICGGGMYWNARRLVNVPVWAFHGGKDACVLPRESEKMVEEVNRTGGNAKITIYPENNHNAWSDTYSNPQLYTWFLEHENENSIPLTDKYDNVENFGQMYSIEFFKGDYNYEMFD